jgi:hypothetical protein
VDLQRKGPLGWERAGIRDEVRVVTRDPLTPRGAAVAAWIEWMQGHSFSGTTWYSVEDYWSKVLSYLFPVKQIL